MKWVTFTLTFTISVILLLTQVSGHYHLNTTEVSIGGLRSDGTFGACRSSK
jgi:hypothetical protein